MKSRVEKQSWKEADADVGECKVLANIVEDEGFAVDAPGAFRRAQSITPKCLYFGGKWVHFEVLRNELTFLHVRKQHNRTFEHACNLFTTRGRGRLPRRSPLALRQSRTSPLARRHPLRVLDGEQSAWPRQSTQTKLRGPRRRW